jgi:hypothetical protein
VHQDKENLNILQGVFHLDSSTIMEYDDQMAILLIVDPTTEQKVTMIFQEELGRDVGVYNEWKREINSRLVRWGGTVRPYTPPVSEPTSELSCYLCVATSITDIFIPGASKR